MKRKLLPIFIGLVIAAALIWVFKRSRQPFDRKPPPAKTAEEILQDRAKLAASKLQTPLGKLIANKNWEEFKKQYSPKTQFLDYAEIIRALYVTSTMNHFNMKEQYQLLGIALESLKEMDKKNYAKAGLLFTQIQRLPPAPHDSGEYKTLEQWLKNADSAPLLQKVAIHKLVLQDGAPDPKYVQTYIRGFKTDFLSMSRSDYIAMADEIRSAKVRKTVMTTLLQEFKSLEKEARPSALIVLSRNLEHIEASPIKRYALTFLKSKNGAEVESALRAIPYLHEIKALSDGDRQKIVAYLGDIPPEAKTPYAEAKAQEITTLFSLKN